MATIAKTEKRLRELRKKKGLSQRQVAEATNQSLASVNRHENQSRGLTPEVMKQYAALYGVDPIDLFVDFGLSETTAQ